MDIASILEWLQQSSLAVQIRDSLFAFPDRIDACHRTDPGLRHDRHRRFEVAGARVDPATVSTGGVGDVEVDMGRVRRDRVDRRAHVHHQRDGLLSTYFRAKIVLLVVAAINVLVFELTAWPDGWAVDQAGSVPPLGRAVAALSLVIWIAVIVSGRMIGFTTTRGSLAERRLSKPTSKTCSACRPLSKQRSDNSRFRFTFRCQAPNREFTFPCLTPDRERHQIVRLMFMARAQDVVAFRVSS